jgi:hypothetical protein
MQWMSLARGGGPLFLHRETADREGHTLRFARNLSKIVFAPSRLGHPGHRLQGNTSGDEAQTFTRGPIEWAEVPCESHGFQQYHVLRGVVS